MRLGVAAAYALQPSPDLRYRILHLSAKLLLTFQQFLPPSLAVADTPDFQSPQTVLRSYMLEAQKGERLRFPFPFFVPLLPRQSPHPDQALLPFVLVLEPNAGILPLADDDNVALPILPPLVCPLVHYIVLVHVGPKR
jgi:hypothetical protein